MTDHCKYLLRSRAALDDFRRRYATFIFSEGERYAEWVDGFPLMVWVDYLRGVPQGNIPVLVGLLCHLYCIGRINVSFHDSRPLVCREPSSLEEWEDWCSKLKPIKIPKKRECYTL